MIKGKWVALFHLSSSKFPGHHGAMVAFKNMLDDGTWASPEEARDAAVHFKETGSFDHVHTVKRRRRRLFKQAQDKEPVEDI